jgi:hypothetical protein
MTAGFYKITALQRGGVKIVLHKMYKCKHYATHCRKLPNISNNVCMLVTQEQGVLSQLLIYRLSIEFSFTSRRVAQLQGILTPLSTVPCSSPLNLRDLLPFLLVSLLGSPLIGICFPWSTQILIATANSFTMEKAAICTIENSATTTSALSATNQMCPGTKFYIAFTLPTPSTSS